MLRIIKINLKKILDFFKSMIKVYKKNNYIQFRIEEICFVKQKVTLQIIGKNSIIKLMILDAIEDLRLLSSLSPEDASLLGHGYAFGLAKSKLYSSLPAITHRKMYSTLCGTRSRYQIHCILRSGEIEYIDTWNNKTFTNYPINIIQDPKLISEFDSYQACHIGILSYKRCNQIDNSSTKDQPKLTLVK